MDYPQKSMKMIMSAHGWNGKQHQPMSPHPTNVHTIFHLFGMMPWGREQVHC
jgi:hypothetical protein